MFKKKLFSGFQSNHACARVLVGVAFSTLAISAHAACNIASPASASMGTQNLGSLRDSTDPTGYKLVGARDVVLSVTCDADQPNFKISLTGITPIPVNLVLWNSTGSVTGALKFQANNAKVNGINVGIKLESLTNSSYSPQADFTSDDSVILDLTGIAANNRKIFSVNLHFTGLLSKSTPVTNQVNLISNFNATVN